MAQRHNAASRRAIAETVMGIRVDRAAGDCQAVANVPIFNITGGRVLVTQLLGEVTVAIAAGANNFKLQSNPTATGTTTDLCAALDIDADPIGTLYSLGGAPATALLRGENGNVQGMSVTGVVVPAGAIECNSAGNVAGEIKWSCFYVPLDDGAYVTAA